MDALVAIAERIPRRVKGMLLGLVAAASFTLLHTTVRYASRELHVFEVTFFRYFIALFFMLPGLLISRLEVLRTRRLHLHLIRSVLLMISMLGLFSALSMSPIAMVTALSFVSPVFASVVAILFLLALYVTMVYGPIAALLVELFPTRIRYTSMSLPYHIGNGWFGGLLPATAFAIVASTGDIYAGLWYPIIFASITVVIGFLFLPETKDVDIKAN